MVLPACGAGFQQRSQEERAGALGDSGAVGREEGCVVVDWVSPSEGSAHTHERVQRIMSRYLFEIPPRRLDICRKHSIQWAEQQGSCQIY